MYPYDYSMNTMHACHVYMHTGVDIHLGRFTFPWQMLGMRIATITVLTHLPHSPTFGHILSTLYMYECYTQTQLGIQSLSDAQCLRLERRKTHLVVSHFEENKARGSGVTHPGIPQDGTLSLSFVGAACSKVPYAYVYIYIYIHTYMYIQYNNFV